jgi:type IV secretion/conjugal transfer VirB4 family ATPase
LTSENAAHLASFATVGEGLDTCSWGDAPVTSFKTLSGSEYGFTFHSSPTSKAPGHTLILGGTNSGKTTLISFLLSQCFKYPNFRVLAFDRLHGLEVTTRMHDGIYIDVVDGVSINPVMLPNDAETKAFLSSWFQVLTGKTDDAATDAIGHAIDQLFTLDPKERSLPNIADAFGLNQQGTMRRSMERWLTGPLSHFFTGKDDLLDFSRPLVTFDMTTLLDLPEVLAPLAYYLFHKLLVSSRDKGGYIVFVDELPKYLASPVFAPKIEMLLQEIRKTDGAFVGAAQSADSILNSPSAAKFLTNIETYIFYPDPRASKAHYIDALGLNESEFHWLTAGNKPREALIKRKSGESTIVNVDLLPLGHYLKAFDSSVDAVSHAKQLMEAHGDAWKTAFLGA